MNLADRIRHELNRTPFIGSGRVADTSPARVAHVRVPPVAARPYVPKDDFERQSLSERRRQQSTMLGGVVHRAVDQVDGALHRVMQGAQGLMPVAEPQTQAAAPAPQQTANPNELRIRWDAPDLLEKVRNFLASDAPAAAAPQEAPKPAKKRARRAKAARPAGIDGFQAQPQAAREQLVRAEAKAPTTADRGGESRFEKSSSVKVDERYLASVIETEDTKIKMRPEPAKGFGPAMLRTGVAMRRAFGGLVSSVRAGLTGYAGAPAAH